MLVAPVTDRLIIAASHETSMDEFRPQTVDILACGHNVEDLVARLDDYWAVDDVIRAKAKDLAQLRRREFRWFTSARLIAKGRRRGQCGWEYYGYAAEAHQTGLDMMRSRLRESEAEVAAMLRTAGITVSIANDGYESYTTTVYADGNALFWM